MLVLSRSGHGNVCGCNVYRILGLDLGLMVHRRTKLSHRKTRRIRRAMSRRMRVSLLVSGIWRKRLLLILILKVLSFVVFLVRREGWIFNFVMH